MFECEHCKKDVMVKARRRLITLEKKTVAMVVSVCTECNRTIATGEIEKEVD